MSVAVALASAVCAWWRARRRAGVPRMYSTMDKGSAPYSTNVKIAPSHVPLALVASTSDIISTTYIQAMAIRYIVRLVGVKVAMDCRHIAVRGARDNVSHGQASVACWRLEEGPQ